jgi:hypothetical protein
VVGGKKYLLKLIIFNNILKKMFKEKNPSKDDYK